MTYPSWENREKFAASREKCFLTEDTPQKQDYIISSYEPSAGLFFLYFNIGPNNNKTKINRPPPHPPPHPKKQKKKKKKQKQKKKKKKKKKMLQEFFCKPLTCLILILFLFFKGAKSIRRVLKKIQKELCIHKDLIMSTFPCKSNKRRRRKKKEIISILPIWPKLYLFAHYYL